MKRLILLLLFATGAYGQSLYRYENILLNQNGQPLTGVNVYVCTGQVTPNYSGTPPCPLATIYSDLAGTIPITQPTTTSPIGNYAFVLQGGLPYTVVFLGPLITGSDLITPPLFPGVNPSGSNTFTGTNSFRTINGVAYADQFPGATADAKITAAMAALPTLGGIVDATGFGCSTQTIANPLAIGSAAQQITILFDRCTNFQISVATGASAIVLYSGSSIWAEGSGNSRTGGFNLTSSANVASLLSFNCNSCQPIINVHGLSIQGNATAVVTNGLVDVLNVTDQASFSDLVIYNFYNTVGLLIRTSGGSSSGPVNFNNITVNGYGNAGARPIKISASGIGIGGTINFFGGSFTHPGSGGLPILDIDNDAGGHFEGINIIGSQFESTNTTDIGINCVNCNGVFATGLLFTAAANAGADCVKISNNGGSTATVSLNNIINFNSWTNTVNNVVNSTAIPYTTDARLVHYDYTEAGFTVGKSSFTSIGQPAADTYAGTSACATSTKAITYGTTFTSTPTVLVFDYTTKGGANLSAGPSTTGFTVSCTGATDAFSWLAIGNPN